MDRKLNCEYEKNLNIREIFKMYLITGKKFNKITVAKNTRASGNPVIGVYTDFKFHIFEKRRHAITSYIYITYYYKKYICFEIFLHIHKNQDLFPRPEKC